MYVQCIRARASVSAWVAVWPVHAILSADVGYRRRGLSWGKR